MNNSKKLMIALVAIMFVLTPAVSLCAREKQDDDVVTGQYRKASIGLARAALDIELSLTSKANIQRLIPSEGHSGVIACIAATHKGYIKFTRGQINTKKSNCTPLMLAVMCGRKDWVAFLLKNGADIEATGNYGATALVMAGERGSSSMVSLLLAAKANIHAQDKEGFTALIRAYNAKNIGALKVLQEACGVEYESKEEFEVVDKDEVMVIFREAEQATRRAQ